MKHTLGLKLSQGLSLTPALQQAIKLLQMSTLDLEMEIQQALDSNLMLEREEGDGPEPAEAGGLDAQTDEPAAPADSRSAEDSENIPTEPELDHDWSDIYSGGETGADQALHDFQQANLHVEEDLKNHLQDQAALENFSPLQALIIDHMIDALDERGYFPDWPQLCDQLQADTGQTEAQLEDLRSRLQQWEPTGIGARDLQECLLLQLATLPSSPTRDLATRIVHAHLAELASERGAKLARNLGCDEAALDQAQKLLRSLTPDPGADFRPHQQEYVAPDIYVRKIQGQWLASINPSITPKLKINALYQDLIRRADNSPDQQMLKQHLQEARYFLHSLKSRNETLLKVAQEIVDRQRGFLEYGPEAMRPLVLRDISSQLGIHESTVSRATAHKYMHTPRGLFELKYFFSSAVSTAEGGSCSATAIQAMIRRLVNEESTSKPLSDSRLTQILQDEGINVARRTVAKYRESLNIPPSHQRKRMA